MPKVLILVHGDTGRTCDLADVVAEGASSVKFTEVEVRRINDVASTGVSGQDVGQAQAHKTSSGRFKALESVDVLAEYDALIFGSPAGDGVMRGAMSRLFKQLEALGARGALVDKVGSAFTSASVSTTPDDTRRMAVGSMLTAMIPFGMILVPPVYREKHMTADGGSTSGDLKTKAHEFEESTIARQLGTRVAKVAEWVRHAKSHERGHSHQGTTNAERT